MIEGVFSDHDGLSERMLDILDHIFDIVKKRYEEFGDENFTATS